MHLALFILIILLADASAFAKVKCPTLVEQLKALDGQPLLEAGSKYQSEILAGEPQRTVNESRRARTKELTANPEAATQLSRQVAQHSASMPPGEVLFALDVLAKAKPELFVDAVLGIVKNPLPATHSARATLLPDVKKQIGSRIVSYLNVAEPAQAVQLLNSMAEKPWLRNHLAGDVNAARALLSALKIIKSSPNAAVKNQYSALSLLAHDWIAPRKNATQAVSGLPEMDWAFSRVLAVEMSRTLQTIDPAASRRFSRIAVELKDTKPLESDRVRSLLNEFSVED